MGILLRTTLMLALPLATAARDSAQQSLNDAVAVWNLSDSGAAGRHPLTAHGRVTVGEELTGEARAASRARGGDGKVARFDGGYLEIGGPATDAPGATFTLLLRVCDLDGAWSAPLFGSYGGDAAVSLFLHGVDGNTLPHEDVDFLGNRMSTPAGWMFGWPGGPRAIPGKAGVLEFIWGATNRPAPFEKMRMLPRDIPGAETTPLWHDAKNAVLRLMFPMEPLGPRAWHDVIVRGTGPKLQLWIDGVLLDEEFPMGSTRPATVPRFLGAAQMEDGRIKAGFHGLMDHAALWHRALSDSEIVALSGGAEVARERTQAVLGPLPERMQYYRPSGHNLKAGDCFPYFHDGTLHLFYLNLRRNMHSKWDGCHGGLEIFHASTANLAQWEHHPVAVPITEQWEAWNGTGAVVNHDGKSWMFYPALDYYGPNGGIQLATSVDGKHYTKQAPHPFLSGGDCEVFRDPDPQKELFHLIKVGPSTTSTLPDLRRQTLVAWVATTVAGQADASVITVAGTDGSSVSLALGDLPPQIAGNAGACTQIAAVHDGNTITLYRDGQRRGESKAAREQLIAAGGLVMLGSKRIGAHGEPIGDFRGAIADARIYNLALTDEEIAKLRPHEMSGPKPLVWFDFQHGTTVDRAGQLASASLEGAATIRDGRLLLGGGRDCLISHSGTRVAMAHWVSGDLLHWSEMSEPLLLPDAGVAAETCPNWFKWNDWYYYLGGNSIWRSPQPYGPWTRQYPRSIDSLAFPKTAGFTGNRRVLAGWLADGDGAFGGNLVLRDLVQLPDGSLGSRFVPEMIPPSGQAIVLEPAERNRLIASPKGRRQLMLDQLPNDVRITLTLAPQGSVTAFGLRLRTTDGETDGTEFRLSPAQGRASFSHRTNSGSRGSLPGGPSIDGLSGLDQPVRIDIICRHDIVDIEVNGRHTLANRFWNPAGNRLGIWVEDGELAIGEVSIRPLLEHTAQGALRQPELREDPAVAREE